MIKIEQLLPLLKKGFVVMEKDGLFYYHSLQPTINKKRGEWDSAGIESIISCLSDASDIEPVKDWTKSLMRCGDE